MIIHLSLKKVIAGNMQFQGTVFNSSQEHTLSTNFSLNEVQRGTMATSIV